ncbi:hypothetical protein GOP47_0016592 [Adiantum capillus-veneris]|uniref:Protein COFACTOR ASSEMBLY OF COMPLEX C SUBUNIT B CCB4, chloroplastic n=1 Tax=Adiantum capillus-veneris TaxID=13818 RepID=A0A9D4UIL7_ADICA|nr:hypothetical protein GOP47_0016592 [Adiantum capillus-veneris]
MDVSLLNFFVTPSRFQFQNSQPIGIASRFQKRTRTSFITCKQAGQDVDSKVRLGLDEWIKKNDERVRAAQALLGTSSFLLVLLNRTLSGIAPVVDASSAQSRGDIIAVVLSATLVLTGLVWISVKPKKLIHVELDGISCLRLEESLPASAAAEVMWAWEALKSISCCRGFVIVYKGCCVLQAGLASVVQGEAKTVDSLNLVKGSLCEAAWRSGKQNYLADLSLYPGRFELSFFPPNTQAVILQPLGDDGIMIVAGDTVRGFGPTDQSWILYIGEKLDATLGKFPFTTCGVKSR